MCGRPKFICKLNCGSNEIFEDPVDWEKHLTSECSLMLVTCIVCGGHETRETERDHFCHSTLIDNLRDFDGAKDILTLF